MPSSGPRTHPRTANTARPWTTAAGSPALAARRVSSGDARAKICYCRRCILSRCLITKGALNAQARSAKRGCWTRITTTTEFLSADPSPAPEVFVHMNTFPHYLEVRPNELKTSCRARPTLPAGWAGPGRAHEVLVHINNALPLYLEAHPHALQRPPGRDSQYLQGAAGPGRAQEVLVRVEQRHERDHEARVRLRHLRLAGGVALHHCAAMTHSASAGLLSGPW